VGMEETNEGGARRTGDRDSYAGGGALRQRPPYNAAILPLTQGVAKLIRGEAPLYTSYAGAGMASIPKRCM